MMRFPKNIGIKIVCVPLGLRTDFVDLFDNGAPYQNQARIPLLVYFNHYYQNTLFIEKIATVF